MTVTASAPPVRTPIDESVLRGEPFSAEHLEQHARKLAESLAPVAQKAKDRQFGARFENNARCLQSAYEETSSAVRQGEPLTADAEW